MVLFLQHFVELCVLVHNLEAIYILRLHHITDLRGDGNAIKEDALGYYCMKTVANGGGGRGGGSAAAAQVGISLTRGCNMSVSLCDNMIARSLDVKC